MLGKEGETMECKVKDVTIYYEETGSGRPLFALHGWTLDHRHMFGDLETLFAERKGWRRIYPDLPGMGRTWAADWITDQDHMLDILLEFIDTVAPGERFVVAGASYGGYMARGVVHHRSEQVDGLMIVVPAVEPEFEKRKLPNHRVLSRDADFLAALGPDEQDLPGLLVVQSMELLDFSRTYLTPAFALADRAFLERLRANYSFSFDVDSLAQPFPAPSLILTGRFDHRCGYREAYQLLDNYPRATFAVLDRAGHALSVEQTALFRALASEWLDRVKEYTRQDSS
jgi:pimeloyl-ACP methyl ester carboxylesterase